MHWLEALEQYLQERRADLRGNGMRSSLILSATVHEEPAKIDLWSLDRVDRWLFEERVTPRGNIALHLFPSAS